MKHECGRSQNPPVFPPHLSAFWRQRSFAHVALTAAAVIIVAGLIFYLLSFGDSPDYVAVNLALSNSNRAESTPPAQVQVAGAGLKVNLALPEQAREAKTFRAKLVDENGVERDLTIDERKDQTVTVTIPAALLSRGSYVIQLFTVKPDGSAERVRGGYNFVVE